MPHIPSGSDSHGSSVSLLHFATVVSHRIVLSVNAAAGPAVRKDTNDLVRRWRRFRCRVCSPDARPTQVLGCNVQHLWFEVLPRLDYDVQQAQMRVASELKRFIKLRDELTQQTK